MRPLVRARRLAAGFTQEHLAQRLGVSRQTVISIETGRYCPSLILAHKLAQVFGCRIEDLFDFDEEQMRDD